MPLGASPAGRHLYQAPERLIVNLATRRGVGRGAARLEWICQAADVRGILDQELAGLPYLEFWSLPRDQDA